MSLFASVNVLILQSTLALVLTSQDGAQAKLGEATKPEAQATPAKKPVRLRIVGQLQAPRMLIQLKDDPKPPGAEAVPPTPARIQQIELQNVVGFLQQEPTKTQSKPELEALKAANAERELLVRRLNEQMTAFVQVNQAHWEIGVMVAPVEDTLRSQLDLPEGRGAVVVRVFPDSPALAAGIQQNDVIIEADDKPIFGRPDLVKFSKGKEGPLKLVLIRKGKKQDLTVNLKDKKTEPGQVHAVILQSGDAWLGVSVTNPSDAVRSQLGIEDHLGLVVTGVEPKSPAEKVKLKANDILLSLNKVDLADVDTLIKQVKTNLGKPIPLDLVRVGKKLTLEVTPEQRPGQPIQLQMQLNSVPQGSFTIVEPGVRVFNQPKPGGPGGGGSGGGAVGIHAVIPPTPVDPRLDAMSKQIEELKRTVEELKNEIHKEK